MKLWLSFANDNKGTATYLQNKPKEFSEFPVSHHHRISMNIHLVNDLTAKTKGIGEEVKKCHICK